MNTQIYLGSTFKRNISLEKMIKDAKTAGYEHMIHYKKDEDEYTLYYKPSTGRCVVVNGDGTVYGCKLHDTLRDKHTAPNTLNGLKYVLNSIYGRNSFPYTNTDNIEEKEDIHYGQRIQNCGL